MMRRTIARSRATLLLLVFAAVASSRAEAKAAPAPDHWVGTWAAASVPLDSQNAPAFGSADMTLRAIVHPSLGGPLLRVVFTNEFGTDPLTLGESHVALAAVPGKQASRQQGSIGLFSANALTFNGSPSITIPPGAVAVSDPFALTLPFAADLAISVFVPAQPLHTVSGHAFADQTSFVAAGNHVGKATLPAGAQPVASWPFVKAVEVLVPASSGAIVCFGDSITDGTRSTQDANARWPDLLARRLHDHGRTRHLAVLNEGVAGNRVLRDGYAPSALARFDRDVLAQSGARYVILLEGINDIGQAFNPQHPGGEPVTADSLIQALAQLAARAHGHRLKVYGATLTPYLGAGYSSPQGEQVRQAVNQWVRTSNLLDGFIDFEKATRDPNHPEVFSPAADSGDHLHPKDGGYKIMADSIDLKLFAGSKESYDITRER